jgi:hypothetical protein
MTDKPRDLLWVFQANDSKGNVITWEKVPFSYDEKSAGSWRSDSVVCPFNSPKLEKGGTLSVFIWNKDKQQAAVDDVTIKISGYQ